MNRGIMSGNFRETGQASPLGVTVTDRGANFSLFSRTATAVELLLFDREDDSQPARVIVIDPVRNRTYHYWHVFVPGIRAGQLYGYRVHGPQTPHHGLRFAPDRLLLDPYGKAVAIPPGYDRTTVMHTGLDNALKSVVTAPQLYDWEGDVPLRRALSRTVIYEMHVRGFTQNPNSGVADGRRGTYAGMIDRIPYLVNLGVTAVELLPIFAFDAQDCPPGKVNYWGYAPVSFFAPHPGYSSRRDALGPVNEFRDLVKALHRSGIEVILDVVFNHTTEGDHRGPTLCFRGIDNPTYYMLDTDRSRYCNFSGCGNTLNVNHPVVRRMIVDSLKYWVTEMHVDGFRFDLAAILSRDEAGQVLPSPPVLWDIETEPELAGVKLIAEAWDAAGLFQVGSFAGDAWQEWNGRFRDDVRDFFRGQPGAAGRMADRLLGSHEVFRHENREAEQSVNFVTCHDGFTVNDLVTYSHKHNERNGENNFDGTNDNRSWNCGVEGPSNEPDIERLRNRQVKNLLATTLLSLGVPMLTMGDEIRRTQHGNNNAYCLDDETTWFDWSLLTQHSDVHRFVRLLISRRVLRDMDDEQKRLSLSELLQRSRTAWHGVRLHQPDWSPHSRSFAFGAELQKEHFVFHLIMNAFSEALDFELPQPPDGKCWRRWIDTALPTPDDICAWECSTVVCGTTYRSQPWSVVVLFANSIGQDLHKPPVAAGEA